MLESKEAHRWGYISYEGDSPKEMYHLNTIHLGHDLVLFSLRIKRLKYTSECEEGLITIVEEPALIQTPVQFQFHYNLSEKSAIGTFVTEMYKTKLIFREDKNEHKSFGTPFSIYHERRNQLLVKSEMPVEITQKIYSYGSGIITMRLTREGRIIVDLEINCRVSARS